MCDQKHQQPVTIHVDGQQPATVAELVQAPPPSQRLLPIEFKAAQLSISSSHLQKHGLSVGRNGELVDDDRVQLFPDGWITAMTTLLCMPSTS